MEPIDLLKQQATKLAHDPRFTSVSALSVICSMLFVLSFCVYGITDLHFEYSFGKAEFDDATIEIVVDSGVYTSGESGNAMYSLTTASGVQFERGIHSPNFDKVTSAIEKGQTLRIRYYDYHFFPAAISKLFPAGDSPTLIQIEADGEIILSVEEVQEAAKDNIFIIAVFKLLAFGAVLCIGLFSWAYVLRLRHNKLT